VITITGSTGRIGGLVARDLAARGLPLRLVVPETVEQAYASRAAYGAPQWQLDAWVSTYTAIANGELAIVSDAVARLTGRPPLPLAAVLSGIG
jgi:NAD(P)H dehydrogenase (quinone)